MYIDTHRGQGRLCDRAINQYLPHGKHAVGFSRSCLLCGSQELLVDYQASIQLAHLRQSFGQYRSVMSSIVNELSQSTCKVVIESCGLKRFGFVASVVPVSENRELQASFDSQSGPAKNKMNIDP